jgi:dolichol-phosphate mannosyltransferase
MPDTLVCTVLPTYNERQNIGPLIERLLLANPQPYRVVVIDDNSPDGTAQIVQELAHAKPQRVTLVSRTDQTGLTSAIQRGIDEAIDELGAGIVTWMDCDLSMPPEVVPALVAAVHGGADLAVGSRWIPGGGDVAHGFSARALSQIINWYAGALLGGQIHDYTSGFIAGRAELFRRLRLRGDYGEYCIDLLGRAQRLGLKVVEIPYVCTPRASGASKTGAGLPDYLIKGRKYVVAAWRARRAP